MAVKIFYESFESTTDERIFSCGDTLMTPVSSR